MKKWGRKSENLINKKPLKLNEENKEENQLFITLFVRSKKPLKPNSENKKENLISNKAETGTMATKSIVVAYQRFKHNI